MQVSVAPPNPHWRTAFEQESQQIAAALGDNSITIHHSGSTSIPGIYAKLIIEIWVEAQGSCRI